MAHPSSFAKVMAIVFCDEKEIAVPTLTTGTLLYTMMAVSPPNCQGRSGKRAGSSVPTNDGREVVCLRIVTGK